MRHNNKDHHRHPLHHQEHDDDGLDEDDRPLSDASSFGGVVEDASGTTVEVRLRDKQRVSQIKNSPALAEKRPAFGRVRCRSFFGQDRTPRKNFNYLEL